MKRRVAILGSTGSIGTSALAVIDKHADRLAASVLSTHSRVDLLLAQAAAHRPAAVAITSRELTAEERRGFESLGTRVYEGPNSLVELAKHDAVDVVLLAVVGAAGLHPALAAVEAGKTLAVANKESLVVGGSLLIPLAQKHGATILPVDSEHNAIYQCLAAGRRDDVRRLILTASGGPFRTAPVEKMRSARVAEALAHPTWQMGAKVTIDSATMFNKALEIIEAHWLFDMPADRIGVMIHPESVVHSMVEFVDGSVIAQLSPPDMKTPIQYALTWPDRLDGTGRRMDFTLASSLHFEPPDLERFPSLQLGFDVIRTGGTSGAVLNAANEVAVNAFLADDIRLGVIYEVVGATLAAHDVKPSPTLDELLQADAWARRHAASLIETQKSR